MILFHVTRPQVVPSIDKHGLLPRYSQGRIVAVWLVDEERVIWALAHTSARWGIPVDQLMVWEVNVNEQALRRWSLEGVFYSVFPIAPTNLWGSERFLKPEYIISP